MELQAACRGGSFAVESVAAFAWNGWQASSGISGNLGLEYALNVNNGYVCLESTLPSSNITYTPNKAQPNFQT